MLIMLIMGTFQATGSGKSFENIEYGNPGGYSLRLDAYVPDGMGPFSRRDYRSRGRLGHR